LIEAMESGRPIDKILFQRNTSGESIGDIRRLAKKLNVPIQQVPPEKMNSLTRANHQGVIAFTALVNYLDLQTVIDHVVSEGNLPLFLMLDGVTDVRNIGAICRSALCCGAQAIIIPDKGTGALNEEAMKSSAGALEHIHVCRVGSLLKAIDTLHANGILVYVSSMDGVQTAAEISWQNPSCILLGSEDKGVQPYLAKAADSHFRIPMAGSFNSFNVSVAAGIILYEAMKHR
jgi:23S rRNA (guanosine2251-2'-O)-methyltransferase